MRFTVLVLLLLIGSPLLHSETITLTPKQASEIGRRIWQNECGGTVEGLVDWNAGEDFASLGIGHFIWYPGGKRGPFEESFPQLLDFLRSRGERLPGALRPGAPCPWKTRAEFLAARDSESVQSLRKLLARTVPLQTEFLIRRLESGMPRILAAAGPERKRVEADFSRLNKSSRGLYAMVDYVNFKGEGLSASERYQGQGWGLLQVLLAMNPAATDPVAEFARAANEVLTRRVQLAPAERGEGRWLEGWRNRLKTY